METFKLVIERRAKVRHALGRITLPREFYQIRSVYCVGKDAKREITKQRKASLMKL